MIGILGGYGDVGGHAARLLARWEAGPLRIGGRDEVRAEKFVANHLASVEAEPAAVDIDDAASLTAFVRDCSLVLHCAGPSHLTSERVTYAALMAGAHLVDAGGSRLPQHVGTAVGERVALYEAGALPGLTGLLPRWLAARHFDDVGELTAYTAVLDRFTTTGAEDYLDGVLGTDSEPLAAWRDGVRRSGALTRLPNQQLPYVPRPVVAWPYLDGEGERLARYLSLSRGSWYTAVDGEHLARALEAAHSRPRAEAVAGLCQATALDVAGRSPYLTMLVQLDGTAARRPATRTAVLKASGISALTGAVTAVAARAVLRGEVTRGAHRADAALDAMTAIERLTAEPGICDLTTYDAAIHELTNTEEGSL